MSEGAENVNAHTVEHGPFVVPWRGTDTIWRGVPVNCGVNLLCTRTTSTCARCTREGAARTVVHLGGGVGRRGADVARGIDSHAARADGGAVGLARLLEVAARVRRHLAAVGEGAHDEEVAADAARVVVRVLRLDRERGLRVARPPSVILYEYIRSERQSERERER